MNKRESFHLGGGTDISGIAIAIYFGGIQFGGSLSVMEVRDVERSVCGIIKENLQQVFAIGMSFVVLPPLRDYHVPIHEKSQASDSRIVLNNHESVKMDDNAVLACK